MDPHVASNELPALSEFINSLNVKGTEMTADQAVVAFREHQEQLIKLRQEIQPAIDELDAGGGRELDLRAIFKNVKQQLADEGITD